MEMTAAAPTSSAPAAAPAKPGKLPLGPDTSKAPEGAEPAKKLWKLNVNGKEREIDASDEEGIKRYVQKGLGADEKFQQSARIEKQMQSLIRQLRENPDGVLADPALGHDVDSLLEKIFKRFGPKARKAAENYLHQQIEQEMLDPRDRELQETKQKMKEYEEQIKAREEAEQQARTEELKKHYSDSYSKDIIGALESSKLPKTPSTVKRVAYYMHQGLKRGVELKAADVVDLVKQDYINETRSLYGALDGEVLISILGDDLTQKLRKVDLDRLKRGQMPRVPRDQQPDGSEPTPKKHYISPDEWRKKQGL